jgi:hypothetical protein
MPFDIGRSAKMAGFFKTLFRKTAAPASATAQQQHDLISYEQLEGKPFDEIVEIVKSFSAFASVPFGSMSAITRRLYQIALYDNHVTQEQRNAAARLADSFSANL